MSLQYAIKQVIGKSDELGYVNEIQCRLNLATENCGGG